MFITPEQFQATGSTLEPMRNNLWCDCGSGKMVADLDWCPAKRMFEAHCDDCRPDPSPVYEPEYCSECGKDMADW